MCSSDLTKGSLTAGANYTIAFTGADLTIGTKAITVTADARSKVYGAADPTLTYTVSPALVAGDGFTGTLSRATGTHVGTYAIGQGTLAAGDNYALTFVPADLTIVPRAVTVTVTAGQAKTYGEDDPASYAYTFSQIGRAHV